MFRIFLDFLIYLSQHTVIAFLALTGVGLALARIWNLDGLVTRLAGPRWRSGLLTATLILIVVFTLISGWYVQLRGYAGEVEPMVTSLSWMVQNGYPLYHDLHSPARYSVLYGPSVFLTNGLFLKVLGPSLAATKLASALAGLGSLLLLFAATTRKGVGTKPTRDPVPVAVVGLAILFFWMQGFAIYLVRPDALLVFAVCLALYSAVKVRKVLAVLAVGVTLGFAVNLKAHAGLYFLPVLVLLARRCGLRALLWALATGAATVGLPFVLYPQISLTNYLIWLNNAMRHGLGIETLPLTSRFTVALLAPVAALLALNPQPGRWLRRQVLLAASYLVAVAGVLVLSAKPGAGLVHLLPLVPSTLYLAALLARDLSPAGLPRPVSPLRQRVGHAVAAAAVLTMALSGLVHEYRVVKLVQWQTANCRDLAGDIADIQATFPGLHLGMAVGGENDCFRSTWLRPLLVFQNNPLLLDPIAVMDCHRSGQDLPPETFAAFSHGQVPVWLVPKFQRPFAKVNWYAPHEPIFSEAFMDHFRANYTPRSQSRFFDIWIWNGLSGEALGEPALAATGAVAPGS